MISMVVILQVRHVGDLGNVHTDRFGHTKIRVNDRQVIIIIILIIVQPCYVCGVYESLYANHEYIKRNPYKHVFMLCSPAIFLSQYLKTMSYRVLGCHIKLTFEPIMLNELPSDTLKNVNKSSLKSFFTILNAYKSALFSLYYLRPSKLSGDSILRSFSMNLKSAKSICLQRGSKSMDNINIPFPSFLLFTPYQRIHQTVMNDTKVLRKEDVMFRTSNNQTPSDKFVKY